MSECLTWGRPLRALDKSEMTLPAGSRERQRPLLLPPSCLKWAPHLGLESKPTAPLCARRPRTSGFSSPAARPPASGPGTGAISAPGPLHWLLPANPPPVPSQPTPSGYSGPSSARCLPAGTARLPGQVYSPSLLHLLLTSKVWFTDLAAPRLAISLSLPGQPEPRRSPTALTPSN